MVGSGVVKAGSELARRRLRRRGGAEEEEMEGDSVV